MPHSHDILVRSDPSAKWSEPTVAAYRNEDHLQELLAADPNRVPGVTGLARAIRELHTAAGYVDVVAVEASGSVTVVECKLASNQDERRKVIGQVQDYASAIWTSGFGEFERGWLARDGEPFDEWLDEGAIETLRANIAEARLHLCIAVDRIDDDLKRLVEYLNAISRADVSVTAIQLAYAKHGSVEILIPETYGAEIAEAKARRSHGGLSWTRRLFVDAVADTGDLPPALRLIEAIDHSMSDLRGDHEPFWFGTYPGGGMHLHPHGLRFPPIEMWVNGAGRVTVRGLWNTFPSVTEHTGFGLIAELLGQAHPGSAKGVLLADLNVEELIDAVLQCAVDINNGFDGDDEGPEVRPTS